MEVFEIPAHKSELQVDSDSSKQNILSSLKEARESSRNGPGYIIDYCKSYFTAIFYCDNLSSDIIHFAYEDLHRGMKRLNEDITTILSNSEGELNEETRVCYLNMIKIFVYCYTQLVIIFEAKEEDKNMNRLNKRKKQTDKTFVIDKKQIIVYLNSLLQVDLKTFWSPPIVEEAFINAISDVCYQFLQCADVKHDKNTLLEIWGFLGTLMKSYNHGKTFIIRIVQLIKLHEHLIYCLPEGFKYLTENYNCKSLIHDIVQEVTEWQTDEKYQDAQGARFCSTLLVEMSMAMPDMMIPEVFYLTNYLYYESPTLRNCVLSVITEVILKVLTKHDLTEDEIESRDDFLSILEEHIRDTSPLVRAKVFQHWTRLQEDNAIPLKFRNVILKKAIEHLYDKGATVRKSAATLITKFISHNVYDFDLQLHKHQKDLEAMEAELKAVETEMEAVVSENTQEMEEKWKSLEAEIKNIVQEEFEAEPEVEVLEEDNILELIKMHLEQKEYRNAVKLCRTADHDVPAWKEFGDKIGEVGKKEMVVLLVKSIFLETRNKETEELYKNYDVLSGKCEIQRDTVTFLTLIDSARPIMVELLETTSIVDMQCAIEFFITARQFNIDKSSQGIMDMLRIMQRNEQERKEAITSAFKTLYLTTDTNNMTEHASIIVERLISLLKDIPANNLEDLQNVIAEWSKKGVIDNGVIDMLWQFFTNRISTSMENRVAALELLRMASLYRLTIVTKNIALISSIAFEKTDDRVQENMHLVGVACKTLAVIGRTKIDMNSESPPFKISPDDDIFQSLLDILSVNFSKKIEFYSYAVPHCINCFYQICSKPETVCEELVRRIISSMISKGENQLVDFQLTRFCQILGCIAINHLDFMDNTLYKELKRRHNIREQKENQKKKKEKKKSNRKRDSVLNQSITLEESTLEGAQAEDADAEFILSILEDNTVTGSGLLSKLAYIIKTVCQRPDLYDDEIIQGAAIIALIRFMLVSSKFCQENMQLLFTIFEKTNYLDLKCTVLYHCSDLLSRFPNIVEPWTPRIYVGLDHPSDKIRKATFFTLSNLILRDMVRVQGQISLLAKCIIDKEPSLNTMSRTFFTQLSHKENNLYNILPDIFSHLVESSGTEDLKTIMKFLFDLMDKQKYMESLVERFCYKFEVTNNTEHCRNIVYCLTLINYNDKALMKLHENFPKYKHLVQDDEVYAYLKQILSNCGKQQVGKVDLKPIITELEKCIESVFEITEGGTMRPPPRPVVASVRKNAKKGPAPKRGRKKGRKKTPSSSDEDSD